MIEDSRDLKKNILKIILYYIFNQKQSIPFTILVIVSIVIENKFFILSLIIRN